MTGYRSRNCQSWYKLPWIDYSECVIPTSELTPGDFIEYSVQKGDTPWGLAVKFLGNGNRYTEIMQANGLINTATIYVGQVLCIPTKTGVTPQPPTTTTHVVVKGDTPWSLATKYLGAGNRYTEIMALNGLGTSANIYVGQLLKIPTKGSSVPTPPPPVPTSRKV